MNRPQVIQVEGQRVEAEREITGYEAEELLRKYGYGQPNEFSTRVEPQVQQNQPALSFEDMIRQEEEKRKADEDRRRMQINGPKPITYNSNSGYDAEIKYGSDDELGFNFKIEITTDMKLPKY
jgi:hypothetical protein